MSEIFETYYKWDIFLSVIGLGALILGEKYLGDYTRYAGMILLIAGLILAGFTRYNQMQLAKASKPEVSKK
jgi:energy-converting hydrogenase Eha subunit A